MTSTHAAHRNALRTGATALAVALATLLLVVAPAVAAGQGAIRLSAARVSPTTSTEGSVVAFEVRYRNLDRVAPDRVWVEVAGRSYTLQGSGPAWDRPVKFAAEVSSLPVGSFGVTFRASAGSDVAKIKSGTITVKASPPTGGSSGGGSGGSSSGGSSSGGSSSGGSSSSGSGDPGTSSGSTSSDTGTSGGSGATTTDATGAAIAPGYERSGGVGGWAEDGWIVPDQSATGDATVGPVVDWGGPTSDAGGLPSSADGAIPPVTGVADPAGGADAGTSIGLGATGAGSQQRPWLTGFALTGSWLPAELGGLGDFGLTPQQRLLSVTMTTTGLVIMTLAFGFLSKRRGDGAPTAPDEVLQASASRAGSFSTASLVPAGAGAGAGPSWPTPDVDPDSHLPRWRRPSLMEARKADPLRSERVHMSLAFADTATGHAGPTVVAGIAAVDGLERRRIRYRLVRLLESPDELRANEIGYLDEGDEVQLVSQQGAYWLVLCPDGQQGWIHRMTLGEIVDPSPHLGSGTRGGAAHDGVDPDVLAAFQASQKAS